MESLTPDETILGLLAIRPRHGYELLDSFRQTDQLGRVWQLSTSQLYAVLKRLERNNWIIGCEITTPKAPTRTEYTITPYGTAILRAWLNEKEPSPSMRRMRVEFLSRLFIARALNIPTGRIVRRQRAACQAYRTELIAQQAKAVPGIEYLALAFQINQFDAALDWIARAELVNDLEADEEE